MSSCCSLNGKTPVAPAVMACPECGNRSKQVEALTVKSLVRHLPFGMTPTQHYFCETASCDVVYFPSNHAAPTFCQGDLLVPVGAKEGSDDGLVCYCFGITRKDILAEIQQKGKSTFPDRIKAAVKAGTCACELKNPSGKCCLGHVTRAIQDSLSTLQEA